MPLPRKFSVKRLKGLSVIATPPPPPSGPDILWWPCDDGSGDIVTATVGPNGIGTFDWSSNTPDSSPFSLLFDGPNQYVQSLANVEYVGNEIITFVAWINSADWGTFETLFDSATDSSAGGYRIYSGGDGNVYIDIIDSDGDAYEGFFAAPSANAWHRIYFILDNDIGLATVYIDGSPVIVTDNGGFHGVSSSFTDQTLYVAAQAGTMNQFIGLMDNIQIYSGTVTP